MSLPADDEDEQFEVALGAWRQFHGLHLDDDAPGQPEIDARLIRYQREQETGAVRDFGAAAMLLAGVGKALADGTRVFVHASSVTDVLVFALTYPTAMVLSGEATIDNPVFEDEREELAYTESEIAAARSIHELTGGPRGMEIRPDQVLFTDHPYQTVIERIRSHPTRPAALNGSGPTTHDITVYRRAQSHEATFFRVNGSGRALDVPRERICRPTQNVLYHNGDVVVCTAPQ